MLLDILQQQLIPTPAFVSITKKDAPMRVPTYRNEYNQKIKMRFFILYNLQLEIINFSVQELA